MSKYLIEKSKKTTLSLDAPEWDNVEKAFLSYDNQSPFVQNPTTYARLVYSDKGITIRFDCSEKDPYKKYHKLNEPACVDSCVEFFFAPDGKVPDRYLNFEQSAGGALLIQTGTCNKRDYIGDKIETFEIEIFDDSEGWKAKWFLPFSFILKYFENFDKNFKGNLQFCNNEKNFFITWNKIEIDHPDFHRPEYFGEFYLV